MSHKLHPLHIRDLVCEYVKTTGTYPGERGTGRTTALALRFIAQATELAGGCSPKLKIHDHYGGGNGYYMLNVIQGIYDKLFANTMTRLAHITVVGTQQGMSPGTYIWIERK